jgi:Transcription- and export-related complex subunit
VIERLAQGGRDKLKEDGLNLSDWLQSLASFWGSLYVIYLFSLYEFGAFLFF